MCVYIHIFKFIYYSVKYLFWFVLSFKQGGIINRKNHDE